MAEKKSDILQGTLDLMVLKALDAMGPMHGYGIALRIEQLSDEALRVNQGTIYLCLGPPRAEGLDQTQSGAPRITTARRSSTTSRGPGGNSSWPRPRTGNAFPGSSDDYCSSERGVTPNDRIEGARCPASRIFQDPRA